MKLLIYLSVLPIITMSSLAVKNNTPTAKDYFSVPGPVVYIQTAYHLSWSSHPADNYYKQEYIPAGEKAETFSHMIIIEALVGDISVTDAVNAKIAELEKRKGFDPLANYHLVENKAGGEYLLDFIISQPSGNAPAVAEWNVYHYTKLKDRAGKNGIQLLAFSKRAYGPATGNFLKALKTDRTKDINIFSAFKIPSVNIKAG